ncbi:hypothetical protein ABT120_41055 [Nonomuraea angiospora]|uniref:hypothetical protein n=1 Tax=Nonomuraea angiospora TaxID=46172 RepID=UPI00333480E6
MVDADADPPWPATAYIPGPSLAEAVTGHGPLPPAAVRVLGAGLAEGPAAIHSTGLVHRATGWKGPTPSPTGSHRTPPP